MSNSGLLECVLDDKMIENTKNMDGSSNILWLESVGDGSIAIAPNTLQH